MSLLAAIIGFIIPGLGQVINREYASGLIIFWLWVFWLIISKYFFEMETIFVLIGWFVFSGYSAFDALLFNAKKIREEDSQLKEYNEMQEEKEKTIKTELAKTREFLRKRT